MEKAQEWVGRMRRRRKRSVEIEGSMEVKTMQL